MPAVNNRQLVEDMVEAEIGKQCFGETYGFSVFQTVQQTAMGNVVVWNIAFTLRKAEPGGGARPHGFIFPIAGDLPTPDEITGAVSQATQGLLATRQAARAKGNGHGRLPGGGKLIIPGQG